jgi:hypothetical protein
MNAHTDAMIIDQISQAELERRLAGSFLSFSIVKLTGQTTPVKERRDIDRSEGIAGGVYPLRRPMGYWAADINVTRRVEVHPSNKGIGDAAYRTKRIKNVKIAGNASNKRKTHRKIEARPFLFGTNTTTIHPVRTDGD